MHVHIYTSLNDLQEDLADYIVQVANQSIAARGRFNFVLTGGNSPKALYQWLAKNLNQSIEWNKVWFFFGDERDVPSDHAEYNGKMAKEHLFDYLDLREEQIFYVNTSLSPEQAAKDYQDRIAAHFIDEPIRFDFILLGMGDDAHTASIFPGTRLVEEKTASVQMVFVEKLNTYRISMTAPLINQARHVAFMAFGIQKAPALKAVLELQELQADRYPAQLIHPENGDLSWYVDEAAASELSAHS